MSMSSQKSTDGGPPTARIPKRRRGHERVLRLIAAATAIFAEKGYRAATMTEIAARAGAPIGSLYQFFPNKDLIADAIIARYGEHLDAALDQIDAQIAGMSARQLSDALLNVMVELSVERRVALNLLDSRWDLPERRPGQFRQALRRRIGNILARWAPELGEERAQVMAIVMHQAMKSLVQLHDDADFPEKAAAIAGWRALFADYLAGHGRLDPVIPAVSRLERPHAVE